jgi:hypothetical protein
MRFRSVRRTSLTREGRRLYAASGRRPPKFVRLRTKVLVDRPRMLWRIVLLALFVPGAAVADAGVTLCKSRAGSGYHQYRLIDGKRCWFTGRTKLPKDQLAWATERSVPSPSRSARTRATRMLQRNDEPRHMQRVVRAPSDPSTETATNQPTKVQTIRYLPQVESFVARWVPIETIDPRWLDHRPSSQWRLF